MTPKQATKQIKELLDALPGKKTTKERLALIIRVKVLVEVIQEQFEKRRKEEAASAAQNRMIKRALKQFLTALDRTMKKHEEVGDTSVREQLTGAIHKAFIRPQPHYALPTNFGMFSEEGNQLVRTAIEKFLAHPEVVAASESLKTPEARLEAFQDYDVESPEGSTCFDYFGYTNKPRAV